MDDEHFLERLERLDDPQVGDALALYYDPQLVRELLDYARARGTSERVAISIDHPREGPFIIVTQGGDFVTTLGRGMSPGALPVVPRGAWDAIRRESTRSREAWAAAREVGLGKARDVTRRFRTGGPRVSLQVMLGMRALGSLLEDTFIRSLRVDLARVAGEAESVKQRASWRRVDDGRFRELGMALWRASHLLVLIAASDVKKRGPEDRFIADMQTIRPSFLFGRIGLMGPLLRSIWAASKLGHVLFATYKAAFRSERIITGICESAAGVAAIGSRFSRYRGEAKKALTIAERVDEPRLETFRSQTGRFFRGLLDEDTDPAVVREMGRQMGEERWAAAVGDKHLRAAPGAFPAALALPALSSMSTTVVDDIDAQYYLAQVAPMLGCLDLEDFYWPEEVVDAIETPDLGDQVRPYFENLRTALTRTENQPVRAAERPGRNEPCSCGSGAKFKRCCGA